jgi:glycosyltransferase involved in cell wall biosynthesis
MRVRGGGPLISVAIHADQLWFSTPGGIGTYIRELVPALERADSTLTLTLFRSRWDSPGPSDEWLNGKRVVQVPAGIGSLYPRWDLLARPRLPPSLAGHEIVHATNPVAIPPAGARQRLVVTVHDVAFEKFPSLYSRRWRWLYRMGLRATERRADAILTPSQATADDVVALTGRERVHVVPLAATLPERHADPSEALRRLGIPSPYVLFVGALEPRKNLVRLVRAYRKAAASGLPHALVLAGWPGWRPDELLSEIAREGPGRIVRSGALAGDDLDAVFRGAAVFVYPSLYEGFGLPVIEAMARGIPTVASAVSSIPEVAGTAAYLVDPRSEDEIASAIERVLTDESVAAQLRARGPAQAKKFTWDATAAGTLAVYREVMAER